MQRVLFLFLSLLVYAGAAEAHFGMIIPSRSMVLSKNEAAIQARIGFAHPFAASGLKMPNQPELTLWNGDQKRRLALTKCQWLGEEAYQTEFSIERPGVYILGLTPHPYYEAAEDRFILHYTKTVIGAFGYEDGYNAQLGQPIEIIPLTRPFGNYAGNSFSGVVLYNGKALANADVEVEFLNENGNYKAPNPYFETQVVHTDANGLFTFAVPWPGWWGFAALTSSGEKIEYQGKLREVELGGVIWLQFYPLPAGK